MGRLAALLPVLLAAATLSACGDDERTAAPASADTTNVTVEVTGTGSPVVVEWRCGGAAPCERARLDELADVIAPPDPTRACTEIYGGPEKAHVTGTLEGSPVDVTIARSDGCGIADYERLFDALGREPPLAP